ncbi:MAG TPA: HlyD family secretion protein [bacterium]|jgi:membrane fusion protein (multidrug efflux system)|nr:HlyD family secretion protein [bacterium]
MTNQNQAAPAQPAKKKNIFPFLIVGVAAVVCFFVVKGYLYEGTDDAYIEAHSLMLAPRIGGEVSKVMVHENDKVKAGQVLAQLDDRDYTTSLSQAEADQKSVEADLEQAQKDYQRVTKLYKAAAVSRQQYDAAIAKKNNLTARLQADQFKADQAKLNLGYTQILAPEDGVIAKKSVEPGMVVPPGQALFGFVSSRERWVTANFKETQLSNIKPGQKVDVEVDAISGKKFDGVVDSIGSSTGSTFTLLPPDNSTGNFTKVVQRVPVKIVLRGLTANDIDHLAAGLSAVVSVKIR